MSNFPSLVSIITPCFNGETYVKRLIESILAQTYPSIEFIFVNDGSTDNTEKIVLSFQNAIERKGYSFKYIYQENAGQAAAINKGLAIFQGEYLTWPDSDDWMSSDCIEKKVDYLKNHNEYALVQCRTNAIYENDLGKVAFSFFRKNTDNHNIFDDLIFEKDIYFAPGGYMVRSDKFLQAIPSRKIYECQTGQNWQLLLPIAYKNQCGFLDETLYFYLVRKNSHSRQEKDFKSLLEKTYRHQDTLEHVIDSIIDMNDEDKLLYKDRIENKYLLKRFNLANNYNQIVELKLFYNKLKYKSLNNKEIKDIYKIKTDPICGFVYKIKCKVVNLLKKIKRRLFH